MIKIIIYLLIFTITTPTFANISTFSNNSNFNSRLNLNQPKTIIATRSNGLQNQRLHRHHCPECHYNYNLTKQNLNALEKHALNKTYNRESNLERLERLENLAFGATQYGDIENRYKNVENAIYSRPQYKTKNSLLSNIANYFSGEATGFTPSLMPYPTYNNIGGFSSNPYMYRPNNGFNNNTFEQYSNGIFGGGWGHSGHDYGTGSSIRILD